MHRLRVLAQLAGSSADFIAEFPEAAAWFARRLQHLMNTEAEQERIDEELRQEKSRRAGHAF